MKQYTTIQEVHQLLEKMYNDLNSICYNNELAPTLITIMKSRHGKDLGWGSAEKIWFQKKGNESHEATAYYEINICADALYLPIHEIACIMLHEMAHIYNAQNDIKDTSRSGTYHNKKFAQTAERHGLVCKEDPNRKNGHCITELADESIRIISNMHYGEIKLIRMNSQKSHGTYKRYVCPGCGSIIRATSSVNVLCIDCNLVYKYEETRSRKVN